MNCIVISIGGLHVSYLGCYGNGRIETPGFDRLAVEGFTFDQCFADTPIPALARRSWWSARYQCLRPTEILDQQPPASISLIESLRAGGIRTILIRDTNDLMCQNAETPAGIDRVIELDRDEHSSAEHVFFAARQWLEGNAAAGPFLLFMDCHGAHPPWSPGERSEADDSIEQPEDENGFDDETDPTSQPTRDDNGGEPNSDEATTAARQTYAEVIANLDDQVGDFLDLLRRSSIWQRTIVILTSDVSALPASLPTEVAVRGTIGEATQHVPLLVRWPGNHDAASRSSSLVQTIDLLPTICEAFGVSYSHALDGRSLLPIIRLQQKQVREHVLMGLPNREMAIRTAGWHLRLSNLTAESLPLPQLFAKPDDRWERNDLAQQYPDVVEQLEKRLWVRTR